MNDAKKNDHAGVHFLPPLAYCIALVAAVVLQLIVPLPLLSGDVTATIVGMVMAVFGGWMMASCAGLLSRSGTNIPPNKPTNVIVKTGFYALTRNPIYVAFMLIYMGVALVMENGWMLLTWLPVLWYIRYHVIAREEAYLSAKFGQDYLDYMARVRRFI